MIINNKEMQFVMEGKTYHCALDVTMSFIGGKWKSVILWYLRKDKKRFSELKRHIPQITEKMLSLELKALEADGILQRTLFPEVPPRVEYCLTEFGQSLLPVLEAMAGWGRKLAETKGELVEVG